MKTSLQITNLTLARGSRKFCRDLSFTIQPGDFWGVLGPNGSGKTTLLHTLAGHLKPHDGQILLNNNLMTTLTARQIAQQVGMLFQELHHAFPQSVYEYCRAARFPHQHLFAAQNAEDDTITAAALQHMKLNEFAEKNIQQLSGGEQRRAAIASLLVQSPAFFLLDEPTNHLDLPYQIHTMNTLADLTRREQRAVVMSLHDINLAARYCSHLLMMFGDGSTLHGACQEILSQENLSRLYQHRIDVIRDGTHSYWQPALS